MEIVISEDETPVADNTSPTTKSPILVVEDELPSNGENLRSALALSKTPPEEAAQNINRSKIFNVTPDTYKNNKESLDSDAAAFERVPNAIEPETEKYLSQSEQHASLGADDIDNMNTFEKHVTYAKQKIFDIPEKQREINDIISEKMDTLDGKIDPAKEERLRSLNAEIGNLNSSAKQYGVGEKEDFAVDILSAGGDIIRSYWDNKELLAGIIGGSAAIGGGTGFVAPIPGATVVGLSAGAIKGAIGGAAIVGFIDGYKQTSRSLYNELDNAVDDQGQPLNIPHQRKVNISQAVGAISGIATSLAGKVLASNNPFLKRFLNPKLASGYLAKAPAVMAKMDILGGIAKTALSEGGEEAFQEFVQTVGSIFGKMDESESSFMNALDESLSSENLKKYAYSGAVGAGSGGIIQTVTSAPGYEGLKQRYQDVQDVTTKKQEVLQAQNDIIEQAELVKQMKMNELSPDEMGKFTQKIFSSLLGGDENVYVHLQDMRDFANSAEKGAAVRKVIDPNGELTKMAQELNTPLTIPKADFLKIVTEFPEISDHMRVTPDSESALEVRNEGKEFAAKLGEAETRRAAVVDSLGLDPLTDEQQSQLKKDILEPVKDSKYFSSRESYLEQSAITPVEGVVNEKEAADLSQAQLEARLAIDKSLVGEVDKRFDRYEEAQYKQDTERDIQIDLERLTKEFSVIESFNRVKDLNEVDSKTVAEHKKKGFSAFAIDPKSLPEDLKAIYLNNPELKKRKTFVEGGIHIEESAILNGLESGEQLLKILAETPTKKQIETRIKNDPLRKAQLTDEISSSMEQTKIVARDEAFTRLTKAHIKEMDYMTKKEWPTLKRGIIKIARKAPSVETLNVKAKENINKMFIRDINPNAFKVGENRSQKAAVEHFVKGEFEQAFDSKEKAALNNELRKESLKAQDKVARNQKFWKRASSESSIQELKDAGMLSAMEEFMSLYKLDGNISGETEQQSFNKFVKEQEQLGNYVPVVPDRLNNTQASFKDLTVEQYSTITEMGQFMFHQAKVKNKLRSNIEERNEIRTGEMIAEQIDTITRDNPKYDEKRTEKPNEGYLSVTESWKEGVATAISAVSSVKTVAFELDDYQLDGFFHKTISQPIKDARTAKRIEVGEFQNRDKEIIKQFYGDKFQDTYNFVTVPEFADIPQLGDGKGNIRKTDLLVLQAYMGDPDGRAAIPNYVDRQGNPLSIETVQKILDQHLTESDAAFVQNFLNDRFKPLEQRSADLHKRTTGIDAEMVKGISVTHKNKVYPGGYYPLRYKMASEDVRAGKFLAQIKDNVSELGMADESHFYASMRTAEMTQQGRLKERTGSVRPLDLNFENFINFTEEALHDLHFREVGIDILKVMKNPFNVKNMKAVVGTKKFVAMLNGVKDVVSKTTERESTLFGDQYQWFNKIIQSAHSVHAMKTIGFNVASAAIQPASLSNLILRVGPKTAVYLSTTNAKMMANINNYEHYVKLAAEINPDIQLEQDGIDHAVVKQSYDFIPASKSFFSKYKNLSGSAIAKIKGVQTKAQDASFFMVREADKFVKVNATLALSEQFLNGDIPGFDLKKVQGMSETERAKTLRSIVQQSSDLSLTANATEDKSPLEKNDVTKIFTRYFTDRRSGLNSVLAQVDKIKGSIRKKDNAQAARQALTLVLATGASAAFISAVRNEDESVFKKLANDEDMLDIVKDTAWEFAKAPVNQTLGNIPLIDNIKYQSEIETRSDYRNVSVPLTSVMSDFAAGVVIMKDVLDQGLQGRLVDLTDVQRKILLTNAGYLAGGAPTNTMYKAYETLNAGSENSGTPYLKNIVEDVHKSIDTYIKEFIDYPEADEFIKDLKEYKKTLPQLNSDVKNIIPENTKDTLKASLSGGQWNKIDPETGAAGIYQFTEESWNELRLRNPDLGLTENGRVAKNPAQQEKAMNLEIQDNTRGLLTYEIPISEVNLLGAHTFGFDNFVAIHEAQEGQKLSDVIGEASGSPVFKNFQTVGDVKKYLSRQINRGK